MYLKEIWRYPVKSMGGEQLQRARLTLDGIEGDRIIQVIDERGRVVTARRYPGLLGFHASLDPSGVPLIDGQPWTDPAVLGAVREVVGPGARLIQNTELDRFDILPLLVTTDGAIAAFGRDHRRLRPNLMIGGVEGLEERNWEGARLIIGDAVIDVRDLRGRCVMTTFDPDTLAHDPSVLRDIVKRFGGKLGLDCDVTQEGVIALNQEVETVHSGTNAVGGR